MPPQGRLCRRRAALAARDPLESAPVGRSPGVLAEIVPVLVPDERAKPLHIAVLVGALLKARVLKHAHEKPVRRVQIERYDALGLLANRLGERVAEGYRLGISHQGIDSLDVGAVQDDGRRFAVGALESALDEFVEDRLVEVGKRQVRHLPRRDLAVGELRGQAFRRLDGYPHGEERGEGEVGECVELRNVLLEDVDQAEVGLPAFDGRDDLVELAFADGAVVQAMLAQLLVQQVEDRVAYVRGCEHVHGRVRR